MTTTQQLNRPHRHMSPTQASTKSPRRAWACGGLDPRNTLEQDATDHLLRIAKTLRGDDENRDSEPPGEALEIDLREITASEYRDLNKILEDWEAQMRANAETFPAKSFELGQSQIEAFVNMIGARNAAVLPGHGMFGPTKTAAVEWQRAYTLHELEGALKKYVHEIRSALLYGLNGTTNPTQIASWLYETTHDAGINWRTVARTEMVRANAAGRLHAIQAMGYEQVWAPPHTGACKQCKRLLEDQVFDLDEVRDQTNYGRPVNEWVACIPLHPHCRHVWLPYVEEVYLALQAEQEALRARGLDDKTLAEMFEESGQVKPGFEDDERLAGYLQETTGKTTDPLDRALNTAIAKARFGAFTTVSKILDPFGKRPPSSS